MTAATIEIDDHEILEALTRLARNIDHLEPALAEIGAAGVDDIKLHFVDQQDPDGNAWEPLSDVTKERRRQGRGSGSAEILRDTGLLKESIAYHVGDYAVEIGSDRAYANMMHFGGEKADYPWLWGDIPARPFVGMSEELRAQILDILHDYLERAV
jgi:phage virion morphogenesis protein